MTITAPRIFFVVGEPSGDILGARLMTALHSKRPDIVFSGIAGPRMEAAGMTSQFPMTDLTLFGLAELLPKLPLVFRRLSETVAAIKSLKPDLVITIDAPDFSFRVAKRLQNSGIPIIHYVAPTVWAWRPGRAKAIQPLFKHLLALFPFEPPYFEKVGLPCTFVGHPLVEAPIASADPEPLRQRLGIGKDQKVLVVLPGSRQTELGALLPVFRSVLEQIKPTQTDLAIIIPTVPHLHETVARGTQNWPFKCHLVESDADKYAAFKLASAALAASGTVALELALAGTPAIIAYRIHALTAMLYRHFIKTPYANLVNILAGRLVVPEFIQENCRADLIAPALMDLLNNTESAAQQRKVLAEVSSLLTPAEKKPADAAAEVILSQLK